MCLKKVLKLREVFNLRVTTGALPIFVWAAEIYLQNRVKYWNSRVLAGCFVIKCEKVIVLGVLKKFWESLQFKK